MHVTIRARSCKGSSHSEKSFNISSLLSAFLFAFDAVVRASHQKSAPADSARNGAKSLSIRHSAYEAFTVEVTNLSIHSVPPIIFVFFFCLDLHLQGTRESTYKRRYLSQLYHYTSWREGGTHVRIRTKNNPLEEHI